MFAAELELPLIENRAPVGAQGDLGGGEGRYCSLPGFPDLLFSIAVSF